jgi:hypothetical protein
LGRGDADAESDAGLVPWQKFAPVGTSENTCDRRCGHRQSSWFGIKDKASPEVLVEWFVSAASQ